MKTSMLLLSLFAAFTVLGQSPEDSTREQSVWHMNLSLGGSYSNVRDQGMSPLRYSGVNGFLSTGFTQQNKNLRHGLILAVELGVLNPAISDEHLSQLTNIRPEIDHYYLRTVHWDALNEQTQLFAGGALNFTGNLREHNRFGNNAFNYDLIAAINLSAAVEHRFEWLNRDFLFYWRTSIPVFAHYFRPSYATSIPPGYIDGRDRSDFSNALSSGSSAFINTFFRWQNRFELRYFLQNGNFLKLGYTWDFYRLNSTHPVHSGVHQLSLGTGFKF